MDLPKVVGDGPVYPDIDPDDKDALIERLVLENAVLRAVNDVLKAASLDGMSNREKTLVIDRLRPCGKWSLRELTSSLGISKSSYEYQRRAIARPDRLAPCARSTSPCAPRRRSSSASCARRAWSPGG